MKKHIGTFIIYTKYKKSLLIIIIIYYCLNAKGKKEELIKSKFYSIFPLKNRGRTLEMSTIKYKNSK